MEILEYFLAITFPIIIILIGILLAHLYSLRKLSKLDDMAEDIKELKQDFSGKIKWTLENLMEIAKQQPHSSGCNPSSEEEQKKSTNAKKS